MSAETTRVECNWPRCTSPRLGKCLAWCKCRCHAIKPIADQPATMVFTPSDLAALIAARVAEALAPIEALADEPVAPYPAECACSHGMGFQFHRWPCQYAGDIPKSALRAALPRLGSYYTGVSR